MNATHNTARQILGWYCEGSFPALFTDSVAVAKRWLEQGHKVCEVIRSTDIAPTAGDALTDAARDVLAERQRQISAEGWTPEHDDNNTAEQLALAAVCYALPQGDYTIPEPPEFWPWDVAWWKPGDRRRELVKAGALILAEIERLDRAAIAARQGGN